MIKYLGSKRELIPALSAIADFLAPETALDMFTGTTRVAQTFKKMGIATAANDIATYSKVLSDCYIVTDRREIDQKILGEILADLEATPGEEGYFTETFCQKARFFQAKNGVRIEAIRNRIEKEFRDDPLYPILLTALLEGADRVDSTVGLQMAFLKNWAKRSHNDLELRAPVLLDGTGKTYHKDANELVAEIPEYDLVYLDPPYNQHRYFTNYHIWETLMRWDQPETYGVAQKRIDSRSEETKSSYNFKREMPKVFFELLAKISAKNLVISYNNESWLQVEEIESALRERYPQVEILEFDYRRYVGAKIGIHNSVGKKVGTVSHLRNKEYVFVASADKELAALGEVFSL